MKQNNMKYKNPNIVEFEDDQYKIKYQTCDMSFDELRKMAMKDMVILISLRHGSGMKENEEEKEISLDSPEGQKILRQHLRDNSCDKSYE